MTPDIGHLPHHYKKVTTYTMCERALYEVLLAEKLCVVYFERKKIIQKDITETKEHLLHTLTLGLSTFHTLHAVHLLSIHLFSLFFSVAQFLMIL